jgi:hypothetical protein
MPQLSADPLGNTQRNPYMKKEYTLLAFPVLIIFCSLMFALCFQGCSVSRPVDYYRNLNYQKGQINQIVLAVDVFIEQSGSGSKSAVDVEKNKNIGRTLIDSLKTKFLRKGYSFSKSYSLVGFRAAKEEYEVIHTSTDTINKSVFPPIYVQPGFGADTIALQALTSFDQYFASKSHSKDYNLDSSRFRRPLNILLYIYAYGREVPYGKRLLSAMLGGITPPTARAKGAYHSMALDMIDAETGRPIFIDMTRPGENSPSIEDFLGDLNELLEGFPDK